MMDSDTRLEQFDTADLLAIDQACDQYENLFSEDGCPSIEDYISAYPAHLQTTLKSELEKLVDELSEIHFSAHGEIQRREIQRERTDDETAPGPRSGASTRGEVERLASRFPREEDVRRRYENRFEWISKLGAGGAAVVWKAQDASLDRHVAVKIPHRYGKVRLDRFLREARLAAKLNHPHVVSVFEVINDGDDCLLVTQLIEGETLAQKISHHQFGVTESLDLMVQILEALEYSHQQGVIHRDLKPHNILLDEQGRPYIADFGLATSSVCDERSITRSGEVLGTPAYMSPEQTNGEPSLTAATDIYSAGVILFQLLTGDLPYRGTIQSVMHQVMHQEPPTLRQRDPSLPKDLNTIVAKCLDKQPERRFATAKEFQDELERVLDGRPILSRPITQLGHAWRWAKRHRALASALSLSFFLLVVIGVGATISAFVFNGQRERERELRELAEQQTQYATLALADAKAAQKLERDAKDKTLETLIELVSVIAILEEIFEASDPASTMLAQGHVGRESPPNLRDVLFKAESSLLRNESLEPLVRAHLMDVVGNSCRGLGYFDNAKRLFEKAEELRIQSLPEEFALANNESDRVVAKEDGSIKTQILLFDQAKHQLYMAQLHHDQGEYELAESGYLAALEKLGSNDAIEKPTRASAEFHYARLLLETHRNDEAQIRFQRVSEILGNQHGSAEPLQIAARMGKLLCDGPLEQQQFASLITLVGDSGWELEIVRDYSSMMRHRQASRFDEAIEDYERVLSGLTTHLHQHHPIVILAKGEFAGLLFDRGNYKEAFPVASELVDVTRRLAPRHPKRVDLLIKLAQELLWSSRIREAEQFYEEAEQISLEIDAPFHHEIEMGLLWTAYAQGNYEEALRRSLICLPFAEKSMAEQQTWIYYAHALVLDKLGRSEEANSYFENSIKATERIRDTLRHPVWLERFGIVLMHHEKFGDAEMVFRRAIESELEQRPADHPRVADRKMFLASCLIQQERFREAVTVLDEALAIREKQLPEDDNRIKEAKRRRDEAANGIAKEK